jgi:hypothetical protein
VPKAIDLFCGLGGWTEGLLAEGYDVTGYDIEAHEYGDQKYPAKLVLRDVLTIHGSEFADADLIVASPPCQAYSYMAMPWSRAKAIAAEYRSGVRSIDDLNALFNACFRIQREACEAAGRYIPMVVENVKGAQPWVGPAKAHFGSFYLWGDVEMVGDRIIAGGLRWDGVRAAKRGAQKRNPDGTEHGQGSWFKIADSKSRGVNGQKVEGFNFHEHAKTGKPGRSFQSAAVAGLTEAGSKCGGGWFGVGNDCSLMRQHTSKSKARKAASAQIAKIPLPLSSYIARAYRP